MRHIFTVSTRQARLAHREDMTPPALVSVQAMLDGCPADQAFTRHALRAVAGTFSVDTFSDRTRAREAFVAAQQALAHVVGDAHEMHAVREDMQTLVALLERRAFRMLFGEVLSSEEVSEAVHLGILGQRHARTDELYALATHLRDAANDAHIAIMRERLAHRRETDEWLCMLEAALAKVQHPHEKVCRLFDRLANRAHVFNDVALTQRLAQFSASHPWLKTEDSSIAA